MCIVHLALRFTIMDIVTDLQIIFINSCAHAYVRNSQFITSRAKPVNTKNKINKKNREKYSRKITHDA